MKKQLFKIGVVLFALVATLLLVSCDMLFDTGNGDDGGETVGNVDRFGYSRPYKGWLTDSVILGSMPDSEELFGDKGASGLLSQDVIDNDGKEIIANSDYYRVTNYLMYFIYGDGIYNLDNIDTYLKFTVITDNQILYDEECVRLGSAYFANIAGDFQVSIDMEKLPDGRLTISDVETVDGLLQGMIIVPFEVLREGTLYADMRVENKSMETSGNYYIDTHSVAHTAHESIDISSSAVSIGGLSTKYLTEEKYNMGDYSDSDLTNAPSFENGATSYMVVDFDLTPLVDGAGGGYVNVMVRVPEAEVMDATIEEAPTGKIEEVVVDNVTAIYASYSVTDTAGEAKRIRMIVRLIPLNEGVANVDIFLTGGEGIRAVGNSYTTVKLVSGVPSLKYTLNRDKESYTASELWQSTLTEIIVPDTYLGLPVTGISSSVLRGNTKLERLVIGSNVTTLYEDTFKGCTALTEVIIGDGVRSLPNGLFKNCERLTSVTLPTGTTRIPSEFFYNCPSLKTVNNAEAIVKIGSSTFWRCSSLTVLNCSNITEIGSGAFNGCTSLKEIDTICITEIQKSTFEGCESLLWFDLTGVVRIRESAFKNCKSFTEIVIPDTCEGIGDYAFTGTSNVKSITLGKNVVADFGRSFDKASLESITMSQENESYYSEGNCIIRKPTEYATTTELCLGCKNSVIPSNVTSIGASAFEGCVGLKSVALPDGITFLNSNVFKGCTSLTDVTLPSTLEQIDRYAFENCTSLTKIKLPNTIKMIWECAFKGCTSLQRVEMKYGTWFAADGPVSNTVGENVSIGSAEKAAVVLTDTHVNKFIKVSQSTGY
ncbi:MAG: leucine-rich repeat protein [Clostridia bacterium]|nr:leucine-rich repeat protein [Clostridia bacterium]